MQKALRLAREKANGGTKPVLSVVPAPPTVPATPHQDVPDVGEMTLSPDEQMLDRVIEGLDIVEMYNRWCGKMHVNAGNKTESIKCSCPNPAHPDKNPSAWMNRQKGTGYCSGCNEGFDLWDIAAWRFGYDVLGYKTDKKQFRDLRDSIATDLGYAKYTTAGKTRYEKAGEEQPEEKPVQPDPVPAANNVIQLHAVPDPPEEGPTPSFDWRTIVPEGTFLDEWMRETTKDTCPEEFHLFSGLMAVGAAVGRNRVLADIPDVVPNLNVCLVGKSGTGKSRAKRHLKEILHKALPFDTNMPFPSGVKMMMPGSGEALVKSFIYEQEDPSNAMGTKIHWPIRGYVEFDEMATLIAKGARVGSSLKTQLMELYDAPLSIGNDTVTGGTLMAERPFGIVMTTTQNKSIRGVLDAKDDASGFINRWVFVTGPSKPPVSINTLHLNFDAAASKLKALHLWASGVKRMEFTEPAFKKFDDFILKTVKPHQSRNEDESDILNRMDLLLKKIVVILACNLKLDIITEEVVDAMIKMYPYLCQVYGAVGVDLTRTEVGDMEEAILQSIATFTANHKRNPTMNEIRRYLAKGKRDIETIGKTLKLMCDTGMLNKEEFKPARGRSSVRFVVVA